MGKISFIPTVMIMTIMIGIVLSQPDCPPCDCVFDTTYGGVKAICSGLQLASIPQTLPSETTTLLIDNNDLRDQSLTTIPALRNLKLLDLSRNQITDICDHAFSNLSSLEVLLIDCNSIQSHQRIFDLRFLKPLTNLIKFSLHRLFFINNVTYECTSCPGTLQILNIDYDSYRFGPSFLKLRRLSMLSLVSNPCSITSLDKTTFQYTPYLEILNISGCAVEHVHPGMFYSLKQLRILDMRIDLQFGDEFQTFMEVTKSLQFSPIEYISYQTRRTLQSSPDMFMYLQNTSLQQLHILCENAPLIRKENYKKLPRSIVELRLIHIMYDSILTELHDHSSLKTLDLSNLATKRPHIFDFALSNLPPFLETYVCRNCPSIFQGWIIKNKKNLKTFIAPHNELSFSYIYFRILYKLEYIDLSNNVISDFLPLTNNMVTYLNLSGNYLRNHLTKKAIKLNMLKKLKFLDLSDNHISLVSMNVFENLRNMKSLNLRNNNIKQFNVRLSKLNKLEVLDLNNNEISMIGAETRKDIARLQTARLHLKGNPLICECEELESLVWMKENKQRIYNIQSLECRISTGEYKTLDNLDKIISNLQANCKSNIVEMSVSVSATTFVLAMIVCVLVYRHRWKLRYLYYAGRRGYRERYNREEVGEDYEFDAFVSFDEMDRRFVIDEMMPELEEKHGLKLCIHHRDFHPGELISENIVKAIQNSRKTIVVLSPSFLESTWCEFEFNMARMEGVSRRQDVVLVLLYEDVPMMKLSKDMATMLKHNCYLEYNHEVFNREVFWLLVQESVQIIRPKD